MICEKDLMILKHLRKEYLKSYYSINTYVGCTINCAYCFLAPIKIVPMRPVKVIEEEELIEEMMRDVLFVKNETVISLNNRTDPFINSEVKNSTFKLLQIMNNKQLKNPITITTKGLLTTSDVKRLDSFTQLNIIIIVTYNGIPESIQPIPNKIQERTMRTVAQSMHIRLLHQFRPIIPYVNDDEKTISHVLNFAKQYCEASIFQGVRINKYIDDRLKERNYHFNGEYNKHKQKSKSVDKVFEDFKLTHTEYAIFEHTSCALSYLYNKPDYNLHFFNIKCNKICDNYSCCTNSFFSCDDNSLKKALREIGIIDGWRIENKKLLIDTRITDEQRSYIRHILHRNVVAPNRESTFSEKIIETLNEGD